METSSFLYNQHSWELRLTLGPNLEVLFAGLHPEAPSPALQDYCQQWISTLELTDLESLVQSSENVVFSKDDLSSSELDFLKHLERAWWSLVRQVLQLDPLLSQYPQISPEDRCLCLCTGVTEKTLQEDARQWMSQTHRLEETISETKAGQGCGQCQSVLAGYRKMFAEYDTSDIDLFSWERLARHRKLLLEGELVCKCKKVVLKDFLEQAVQSSLNKDHDDSYKKILMQQLLQRWQLNYKVCLSCEECANEVQSCAQEEINNRSK